MTAVRLRYLHRYRDRHGRMRTYLRRPGHQPIALPDPTAPEFLAAYYAALAQTEPAPPSAHRKVAPGSFDALAVSYYASPHFRQLRGSTAAVYRRIIERLRADHGSKPVALLNEAGVRRIVAGLTDTPAAANHTLRTLRAMLDHAKTEGLIQGRNPAREVGRLKEAGGGSPTWTEDDIAAFEARWAIGTRARLALALMLYTGQRRSDVIRIGPQHIRDGVLRVRQVKTGTEVAIPVHPDLRRVLDATPTGQLAFLVTEAGRPFASPTAFYNWFHDCTAAAGIANRSPHGLRKAMARRLAEAGCTVHEIAAVTGHRTLAEVQRYTKAVEQERMAGTAIARIGGKPKRRLANRTPRSG